MPVTGIIAEFNPLHSGHALLLQHAAAQGQTVCVLSGNFVQRGEPAILEKRIRAKAALSCGADLVLELPVPWSMSTAQNFALGAVSILNDFGCDAILFGSESGEIEALKNAAGLISTCAYRDRLAEELKKGVTFAKARENAAASLGVAPKLLAEPNNNLGIEYILAGQSLGAKLMWKTIKREGAGHHSAWVSEKYASSAALRRLLQNGEFSAAFSYIPTAAQDFTASDIADIQRLERAILCALRRKSIEELATLPDISEGLENKIYSAARVATNLDMLYNSIKTKRYPLSRVRRLCLSAFLGIDRAFFLQRPPYLRVLGFSKAGEALLKKKIGACPTPVVMRAHEFKDLDPGSQQVFEIECRVTDLYGLSHQKPLPCGLEYTSKIIKTE